MSQEKLTANVTPEKAVNQVDVNEKLMELARRVKLQGKKATPEQVSEALKLVGQYEDTTKIIDAELFDKVIKELNAGLGEMIAEVDKLFVGKKGKLKNKFHKLIK